MGLLDQSRSTGALDAHSAPEETDATVCAPPPGTYLTDGEAHFWVAHTLADPLSSDLFLELEDCRTLEVVLCPAHTVAASELHTVVPAAG